MSRGPLPPLVHKIICGRKLAILRERSGITQKEAAEHYGWSQSKVAYIEGATSAMREDDLDRLLDLYKASGEAREECHTLAKRGKMPVPRRKSVLRNRFSGDMRYVIDMESTAATISRYNCMVIPGLLQTEEYMRYIFQAFRPSLSQEKIDQDVADRLARQIVLDNTDQQFWFVIHEAALRSLEGIEGGNSVLRGQVGRLMEAMSKPNIEVQVAPFKHGYYPGQAENYVIFGFDTDPPVRVTYVEKYDGGDILHDEKSLTRFTAAWEHHRVHALGPEQTRPFLREMSRSS
jgi:transcriptional regulator with XRE-family HTH domain